MTPQEHASFIAAKTVAVAQSYMHGGSTPADLDKHSDQLICELLMLNSAETEALTIATRLLLVTMRRTAMAAGDREARWATIMAAFVELVKLEARAFAAPADHGSHGDGNCGCTERCRDRGNCQYDVTPTARVGE